MINIKPVIVNSLKNSAALTKLLKGQHVYRQFPAESVDYKTHSLIVYSETGNKTLEKGDEIELVAKITFQIDIWSTSSTSEIAIQVDEVMTRLGGERIDASDDDQDAPRQCKAMAFFFIADNQGTIY